MVVRNRGDAGQDKVQRINRYLGSAEAYSGFSLELITSQSLFAFKAVADSVKSMDAQIDCH
jgi:hypothetical protein